MQRIGRRVDRPESQVFPRGCLLAALLRGTGMQAQIFADGANRPVDQGIDLTLLPSFHVQNVVMLHHIDTPPCKDRAGIIRTGCLQGLVLGLGALGRDGVEGGVLADIADGAVHQLVDLGLLPALDVENLIMLAHVKTSFGSLAFLAGWFLLSFPFLQSEL